MEFEDLVKKTTYFGSKKDLVEWLERNWYK